MINDYRFFKLLKRKGLKRINKTNEPKLIYTLSYSNGSFIA